MARLLGMILAAGIVLCVIGSCASVLVAAPVLSSSIEGNRERSRPAFVQAAELICSSGAVSRGAEDTIIDMAFGYATICNVEMVDRLTSVVLKTTTSDSVKAHCHWTRALAYVLYGIEYRSDRYAHLADSEVELVVQSDRDLLNHVLCRQLAVYREILDKQDDAYLPKPYGNCALGEGAAYGYAASVSEANGLTTSARELRTKSVALLRQAYQEHTDEYEALVWYIDGLIRMGNLTEAEELLPRLRQSNWQDTRLEDGESSPCKYLGFAINIDPVRGWSLYDDWITSGLADAATLYARTTVVTRDVSAAKASRLWGQLVESLERGELAMEAWQVRLLTSAYYNLAYWQRMDGFFEASLVSSAQVCALSPHYAEVHLERAEAYIGLCSRGADKSQVGEWLERAEEEARAQIEFNWHGEARKHAGEVIARISAIRYNERSK